MDARDVSASVKKGDLKGVAINSIGLIPGIGAFKYSDEVGELLQGANKISKNSDKVADAAKRLDDVFESTDEATDGVESSFKTLELSKNNIHHIKKHTVEGLKEQAKYLTDEQLSKKLRNMSFFKADWSETEVIKYTQEVYNILKKQGKTGLNSVSINDEIINVFIKSDGTFDTAYGNYKYSVKDFR